MRASHHFVTVTTKGRGLYDITDEIRSFIARSGVQNGLCNVYIEHTSASLVIQENADPAVLRDMQKWIHRVAPEGSMYEHDAEGPDDMPAHLRSCITRTNEAIPVANGELGLGTWQAIYVWEHRTSGHRRRLTITVMGV